MIGRALRDLDGIYTYIAETFQEPGTALKLVETIEQEIFSLDHMPYRWPERRRGIYANRGYRQLLVKNYTVIYRVDEANKLVIVVTVRYSTKRFLKNLLTWQQNNRKLSCQRREKVVE